MNRRTVRRKNILDRKEINMLSSTEGILLSILIPTLFTRKKVFSELTDKLMKQIEENNLKDVVEIISHYDSKTIDMVNKRNNMLRTASGKFIAYLDDDDDVADTYMIDIITSIKDNLDTDVITFKQHCNCDGYTFFVESDIKYSLSGEKRNNTIYRYPWIWCAWQREKLLNLNIVEEGRRYKNWEEDKYILTKIIQSRNFKREVKIDKILHYYRYSSSKTECPVGQ